MSRKKNTRTQAQTHTSETANENRFERDLLLKAYKIHVRTILIWKLRISCHQICMGLFWFFSSSSSFSSFTFRYACAYYICLLWRLRLNDLLFWKVAYWRPFGVRNRQKATIKSHQIEFRQFKVRQQQKNYDSGSGESKESICKDIDDKGHIKKPSKMECEYTSLLMHSMNKKMKGKLFVSLCAFLILFVLYTFRFSC